jgi:hypothetical protein
MSVVDSKVLQAMQDMEPDLQKSFESMFWDGFNAGMEMASRIADVIELKQHNAVGDPRIPKYSPVIGKAIREAQNEHKGN